MAPAYALAVVAVSALAALFNTRPAERVVLLPGPDGKTGAVVVTSNSGQLLLNQPYASASISAGGNIKAVQEQATTVRERYSGALVAQPARPVSFSVLFVRGKDEPTDEARLLLDKIKAEIAQRAAPEIIVIGHTDRQGSDADNDELSLKRAEATRKELIDAGIAASSINIAARGERELAVPTADEVAEPRNCRVEISVR